MSRAARPDPSEAALDAARARSALLGRPGFLMRRLHQIHTALFLEETDAFGITPVQYSLLTALAEHGEMDQNTLALEIGLERTSAAEVLPRLEARGVLERRQWPEDRRVKLVRLTRRGRELVRRMAPAVQRAHDRTIEQLDPAERKQFMLLMIRLVEANNDTRVAPLRLR
ncbi:MAG: MarR family transcriptional regulator [Burkholderiales bacterium]|nr:MAG: MarR family transcriptional regulator [Burkholderiales bacterium]